MIAEVDLGLVEDHPAARPAFSGTERADQFAAEMAAGQGMLGRRPRMRPQAPVDDLGDQARRNIHQIGIGCEPFGGG